MSHHPNTSSNPRSKPRRGQSWRALVLALLAVSVRSPAHAQALSDAALARISFEQKLNTQVSLDLPFRDESGQAVRLGDYFGQKPVILVLGYYQCPMLCTLVANGMVESLEDVKWSIGHEFDVVHVSIDPRETPDLAAAKKRNYLKRYGRSGAAQGWHFLTGQDTAIRRLADEVGFQYAYDAPSHQYAHASGLIILTPQGKVARYLFGVTYSPSDLFQALAVASANKVGSPVQRLILLCFHYNPITGKYGAAIMLVIRLLSVATVLALLGLILTLARNRGRTVGPKQPVLSAPGAPQPAPKP